MGIAAPERPTAAGHGGMSEAERAKQVRQAEELLFSGPSKGGFAKALFRGEFHAESLFPYPMLPQAERATVDRAVAEVKAFAESSIDADAIDRNAEIPQSVVDGLGRLGVLGMTAPVEVGGRGFTQSGYCRIMEVIGGHCAGTGVFVNAHHSIGIRALVLFGTPEQKARWLPELTSGRTLAAFALTETEAGSDASNVQTIATPSPDGQTYILNGTKRWITNGGIAGVLTVMARTPDPKGGDSKITAFLVTPDMPGFEVVEKRMDKFSIRGTATGRLAFRDMPVPAANVLGPLGKGLRVALTVLDFGRVTFGASCTGVAKECLRLATEHALRRRQFGRPLADIELVRNQLAFLAASAYAMEATTYETAALIDRGADDYMLETAILKVFATEELWQGVYETMQVYGGSESFFAEQAVRADDARTPRLNTVGEGANEVLKAFIALVGMRDVGEGFKDTLGDLKNPLKTLPTLWRFGSIRAHRAMTDPARPGRLGLAPAPCPRRGQAGPLTRPGGRAAVDEAPRGDPGDAIHPGEDRRDRRDRPGDLRLHPSPGSTGPWRAARRRSWTGPPPTSTSARPPASSTAASTTSSTTRTPRRRRPHWRRSGRSADVRREVVRRSA